MTTKIAAVANLALHTFQQYSLRATVPSIARTNALTDPHVPNGYENMDTCLPPSQNSKDTPTSDLIQRLLTSVNSLSPKDIGFDSRWVVDSPIYAAPVAYVHIMENEVFSMGIFILRPGSRIPLHDHPGMYGVLRVMYGSLRCHSFNRVQNLKPNSPGYPRSSLSSFPGSQWQFTDLLLARPHRNVVLTPDSYSQLLSPTLGNLHELTPVDGIAVFLDILAPPYDHDLGTRECHFYKEIVMPHPVPKGLSLWNDTAASLHTPELEKSNNDPVSDRTEEPDANDMNSESSLIYLVETNQPKDYWCESAEYIGPSVV